MLRNTILQGEIAQLKTQLAAAPELANQLISQQTGGSTRVHPIHWVCDVVFEKKMAESTALEMVKALVAAGTDINGNIPGSTSRDTPLITASSLYCDAIALYLLDQGADPKTRGTHRATVLHWASWTGSAAVVERLLQEDVDLDDQEDEFQSTPLLWAINGWLNPKPQNKRAQPKVMELLLAAGADPKLKDGDGQRAIDILQERGETELVQLLERYNS